MLKFTINKKDIKTYEEKIIPENILHATDILNFKTLNPHGLRDGDVINLRRVDIDGDILFSENIPISVMDKSQFSTELFKPLTNKCIKCEKVEVYSPILKKNLYSIKITLENESKILINRNEIKHSTIPNEVNTPTTLRRCPGDLVNYNNIFLLKATKVENNKYVEYEDKYYNTVENVSFIFGGTRIDMTILIPLTYNGSDDQFIFYWFYDKKESLNVNYLLRHYSEGIFSYEDTRFLKRNDENYDFRKDFDGNIDSFVFFIKNTLDIDFSTKENFDVTLLKNDYYKDFYIEETINENINDIVDMEKQIFIPKLEKMGPNCVVNDIKINVNIRERKNGWNSTLIENTWYNGEKDGKTKITDIGFSVDDIKYQKSALKKSFLRLSFYDTPNRGNQKLLYYSTIFLDSNKIFSDYFTKGEISDLEFTIKNCFDYFSCSEGYYLYLFPKIAKKDIPTTIYMKIEFNHAKYGKTIPLVLPSDDDYKNGYNNENTVGTSAMKKLFNDLYIKVNIMYDSKNNKYVWSIPDILNSNGELYNRVNDNINKRINLTLYEPIINKI